MGICTWAVTPTLWEETRELMALAGLRFSTKPFVKGRKKVESDAAGHPVSSFGFCTPSSDTPTLSQINFSFLNSRSSLATK